MNDLPQEPAEPSKNPRRLWVAILIPLLGFAGYLFLMQDQHHLHEETLVAMTESIEKFDSTLQNFPPFSEYYEQKYDPSMRPLVHDFLTTIPPPYEVRSWEEYSFLQKYYYEDDAQGIHTEMVQLCDPGHAFCLGFWFDDENRLINLEVSGFDFQISPKDHSHEHEHEHEHDHGHQDSLPAIEE